MESSLRDTVTEGHPVGYSGGTNQYRRGVAVGNYAEEVLSSDFAGRPGFVLDRGGAFEGTSVSRATYTPHHAPKPARDDLALKYVKYGRSEALPGDGTAAFATVSQLAYAPAGQAPPRVQDLLWAGTKFVDRKVPLSAPGAVSLKQERHRQWDEEQSRYPYLTVEREQLEAVAQSPERIRAKPAQCRPKAEGGQEAQVGRKAMGPCAEWYDKDWQRIGLRKAGKSAHAGSP